MQHDVGTLWALTRGELSPEQAAACEAHLKACAQCRASLEQVKQAQRAVAQADAPALDAARWERIDAKVLSAARALLEEAPAEAKVLPLRARWRGPAAVAFALAAATVLVLVLWRPAPTPVQPPVAVEPPVTTTAPAVALAGEVVEASEARAAEEPVEPKAAVRVGARLSTERQGKLSFRLPQGSQVSLRGATELVVSAASAESVRLELAAGAVELQVEKDESRHFEVAADDVVVTVTGTRFLVERVDGQVVVHVSEGRVRVRAQDQSVDVRAGERAVAGGGAVRVAAYQSAPKRAEPAAASSPPPVPEPVPVPAEVDAGSVAVESELPPPPLPPPGPVADSSAARDGGRDPLARLKALQVESPFPPLGMSMREHRVRQMERLADLGQCEKMLERAQAWHLEFGGQADAKDLQRTVFLTEARCLAKLERHEEAEAARHRAR